jgi:ribosomal protein S18 acetylase RimI-like enzyme
MATGLEIGETRDREALDAFLRRDLAAHLYALADLDTFFFPETRWFVARGGEELAAVCLLLEKLALPIVHALARPGDAALPALLRGIAPRLPARIFASLSPGLLDGLAPVFSVERSGAYFKLLLAEPGALAGADTTGVERLGREALPEIEAFYARDAYLPGEVGGRFFAPYMIERWPCFGLRIEGRLASIACVHVLSQERGVAAIGGVATAPRLRGQGLARRVTARLARELLRRVPHVGLNVAAANAPALRCYERLGFRTGFRYDEAILARST